ncbi:MAG TPA: hypothetical protein VFM88_02545 [Vicinamibacteria bacterium]|nr:hypothetical protein [Vicinamibacteria bacterium]
MTGAAGDALEQPDFQLRDGRGLAVAEKWYLDALLPRPDPALLVLTLVSLRVLGLPPLAWAAAELRSADGSVRRGATRARRVRGGHGWLEFGPVSIAGPRLRFRLGRLDGDLEIRPRHRPAVLCDPIVRDTRQLVRWWVEVPDADVSGRLWWPGGGREVKARGYRDRVYAKAKPWRFPLVKLRWGHAAADDLATVWFEAETAEGTIRAGWENGRVESALPRLPRLEDARLVLRERLAERLTGRARWLRPIARFLTSDPCQLRWTADARLGNAWGRATYEEVAWGSAGLPLVA